MTDLPHTDDHEPEHAESPTAHLLHELQLFGYRAFEGEPDPRPLPEDRLVRAAVADTFNSIAVFPKKLFAAATPLANVGYRRPSAVNWL